MSNSVVRPIIAVDIDDVLFPFIDGVAKYHNSLKNTDLSVDDFFSFNLIEVWGGTQKETEEIVQGFLEAGNLHLQPVDGAKEALAQLKNDFDVVLVTARNQVFESQTAGWLQQHLPDLFQDVTFAGNPHDGRPYRHKGDICRELGAQLLIDDYPKNLLSAASCGVDGILFGSKAWSVLDDSKINIVPCADWDAVMDYIYNDWRK